MNFVILGAGPAGIYAVEAIRKLDQHDSITLISGEPQFALPGDADLLDGREGSQKKSPL